VRNRRRVVYYAILLLLILGELLGERNYIIIIFLEYDTRKTWDHAIDLKKTFKLQKERIYSLSKNKREEVQKFMEDQLRKGYIRPSKLFQTSLVFFVGKKDSSKRMMIDYCNLNNQMIKNNYLLLLIIELINNMESKKVFTKIDLR